MMTRIATAGLILAFTLGTATAWAKIPPPPPPDDKAKAAAAEKKVKDDAAAAQGKLDQAAAEDKAVKNFQANMKKMGKPIPKPTPVVAAATPAQVMPGPGAAKGQETGKPGDNRTATTGAADAKGHEKGAMTPSGNTPPKGNEMPADAKKK
jgi:hypothetical protein